jgi:hypothetical protein
VFFGDHQGVGAYVVPSFINGCREAQMWFAIIGALLVVAALLGPRLGANFYTSGRPGVKGEVENNLYRRVATGVIGVVLVLFGLRDYFVK